MKMDTAETFSGKRVLVTGAGGYIAGNLIARLAKLPCTVVRASRNTKDLPAIRNPACRFIDVEATPGNLDTFSKLLRRSDIIYHLAAQTSVYTAERDPLADLQANMLPMLNILEACRSGKRMPIVIFAGTVTEAGIPDKLPVNEDFPDRPVTIYDTHKLMAETYLSYFARTNAVKGTTLRLANVYGPGPASSSSDRGILNLMMRKALDGECLTVYGKGGHLRDYVHVDDVVEAFLLAAARIESLNEQHFVIGSGKGHSILDAITLVAENAENLTGQRAKVIHVPPPSNLAAIEHRDFVADISRFRALTGWTPRYTLSEGIKMTLAAFRQTASERPHSKRQSRKQC